MRSQAVGQISALIIFCQRLSPYRNRDLFIVLIFPYRNHLNLEITSQIICRSFVHQKQKIPLNQSVETGKCSRNSLAELLKRPQAVCSNRR
jgi:hypothetical protein